MAETVNGMGIADILIIGAELRHDFVDIGCEAEASVVTRLESSGKKYKATIKVEECFDEDEE